ncbi:MAG: hypothetical protein HKM95_14470 [Inquilinus sp.]|nr:hypothetical protein [Inquilinus sp.]
MDVPITAVLASLLALLLMVLSFRVIGQRRRAKVALGDGGDVGLQRAIRGQANCAEYVPVGILLTLVAELQGLNPILLAVLAAVFLAGRAMHGYAFAFTEGSPVLRVGGMQLTVAPIVVLAVANVAMAGFGLSG